MCNKIFLLIIFLFTLLDLSGQVCKPNRCKEIIGKLGAKDNPEFIGMGTITKFGVNCSKDELNPDRSCFYWIVFGGKILSKDAVNRSEYFNGVRYSTSRLYICGVDSDNCSTINVKWDSYITKDKEGFIAVRQASDYNCSDGIWNIYYTKIISSIKFNAELLKVYPTCEEGNIKIDIKVTGGEKWQLGLMKNLSVSDVEVVELNKADATEIEKGKYQLSLELPTKSSDVNKYIKYSIKSFNIILPHGENIAKGTVNGLPQKGFVFPNPKTSNIKHN